MSFSNIFSQGFNPTPGGRAVIANNDPANNDPSTQDDDPPSTTAAAPPASKPPVQSAAPSATAGPAPTEAGQDDDSDGPANPAPTPPPAPAAKPLSRRPPPALPTPPPAPAPAAHPDRFNYTVFTSNPALAETFAPEIAQERQYQAQDAYNEQQAAEQQARQWNADMQMHAAQTGLRTVRDANGLLQPLTDPDSGQPLYHPHSRPVDYDAQGKPFQESVDQYGYVEIAPVW